MKRLTGLDHHKKRLAEMRTLALMLYEDVHRRPAEAPAELVEVTRMRDWLIWFMPMATARDLPALAKTWRSEERLARIGKGLRLVD